MFVFRMSKARIKSEHGFGILVARWRLFEGPINCDPRNALKFIMACCVLHNYLNKTSNPRTIPAIAAMPQDQLLPLNHVGNHAGRAPITIRDSFADYFTNIAPLPHQDAYINRGFNGN